MNSIKYQNQDIQPSKIICAARNYVANVEELKNDTLGEPVIFFKPNSAISDDVILETDETIDYEGEICFLVKGGEFSAVGFGLDLTKRYVLQKINETGLPWEKAKAFDGSAIFSEFIPFDGDIKSLNLELIINGELRQKGGYDLMRFKPEILLQDIRRDFDLEDGDIIMTGTPVGIDKTIKNDEYLGRIYSNNDLLVEQNWVVQ